MKSKNTLLITMGLLLVVSLLATGCTQPAAAPATTTPVVTTTAPATAGLANPASVNCGRIGGTTEIKTNPAGSQYGMCNFPNGTTCEEWALFRDEGCNNGTAVTTTAPVGAGMANPASVNCGKAGATSEIMNNPDGSQYGMCKFSNGTTCEEWALFRGEGCKPNVAPNATPVK
jgi:putative hemolysin